MIKIGITERGDAGLNYEWIPAIANHQVDGAILITKQINERFIHEVLTLYFNGFQNMIVHCTCTGYGGTILEPNVPSYVVQLNALKRLIDMGFPKAQCVLRIDPIIPTNEGLEAVHLVLTYAMQIGLTTPNDPIRIRVSILDDYRHVKERFLNNGLQPVYPNQFSASYEQLNAVIEWFHSMYDQTSHAFHKIECCAESKLYQLAKTTRLYFDLFEQVGCISHKDLAIMDIPMNADMTINPQNRNGCSCLSCKQELLKTRKPCGHGCLYCYWKS